MLIFFNKKIWHASGARETNEEVRYRKQNHLNNKANLHFIDFCVLYYSSRFPGLVNEHSSHFKPFVALAVIQVTFLKTGQWSLVYLEETLQLPITLPVQEVQGCHASTLNIYYYELCDFWKALEYTQ